MKALTFQAPIFKYVDDNSKEIILPSAEIPGSDYLTRDITFKVEGQDESFSTEDYFTYEVIDNGVTNSQLSEVEFTMPGHCISETF